MNLWIRFRFSYAYLILFYCVTFSFATDCLGNNVETNPKSTKSDNSKNHLENKIKNRPNIILILADDQSYQDFGFTGNRLVHTPNIDKLAAKSARFNNGYVPMSVCRPSLATILTGLYPHQHGIHFNHPPPGLTKMRNKMSAKEYHKTRSTTDYLIQNTPTLPRILASNGYACLQTGKHWEGDYKTAGFTHGMTTSRPTKKLGPVTGTRKQANGEWVAHGNGDAGLVIGRQTMKPIKEFIDNHAGKQPFFVWYAPFLPHTPFDAPKKYHDIYHGRKIPIHLEPYYAEIARFDDTVGQLMKYIDQHDLFNNTMILLASDNGFRPDKNSPHKYNKRSKLSVFEDGLKTPILIYWKGKTIQADHDQLISTVDLLPTILSAIGLSSERTSRMKGRNLFPSVCGKERLSDQPVYGSIYPNDAHSLGNPSRHLTGRWIRSGHYKLILPGSGKKPLTKSLYNLKKDPGEKFNLISNPEEAERIAKLTKMLDDWWTGNSDSEVTLPH